MSGGWRLVVTCEHGGDHVPAPWTQRFHGRTALLRGHRGWDAGALELARGLARRFGAPLVATSVSRLLVDTNRSLGHRELFSAATRALSPAERDAIVTRWYRPYRARVAAVIERATRSGTPVAHVACHSFTPVLHRVRRRTDIGLLFDPARALESALAAAWQRALHDEAPDLRVHRNRPYRGVSDGLTTALRRVHVPGRYAGIELEVNQRLVRGTPARWRAVRKVIADALARALRERAA